MRYVHTAICLPFLVVIAIAASTTSAAADCSVLLEQFNSALAARSLPQAKAIEAQIATDAVCGGRLVEVQRGRAALQLDLAKPLMTGGVPGPEAERLLVEADEPEVLWQAAKVIGDIRFSQRRYAEAAAAFERGLEIIENPGKTPRAPAAETIRQIHDRATQSRLLAANEEDKQHPAVYVAAAKSHRDGSPGGSFSEDIRGFKPKVIPLPIRFETASAVLSPIGSKAAGELLEVLQHQPSKQITIVGHTDERGGDVYNLRLSEERVKTVKRYLQERGIQAPITTIGKGFHEPLKLDNASDFTREELWALNRRVEWRRE
jgi:outer membrane protein OmpA-like peptidoglycan-associated protein